MVEGRGYSLQERGLCQLEKRQRENVEIRSWPHTDLMKKVIQQFRERLQDLQTRTFSRADFLVLELPRLRVRDVDRSQSDV